MTSQRVGLVLAIAALGALALGTHDRLLDERNEFTDDADVLYVPPATYLRPMSLGYREALADLLWIRALIFSGESIGETDIDSIERYVDAIAGLSPRFERVYSWGGVTAVYGGGPVVTRKMVDQSIATYRRGLEEFPESHRLLYPLAMQLVQQVPSTPGYTPDEVAAAKAEGVELIRRAAAFGADPLVRQFAATLVSDNATDQLARQFLESQLAQAENEGFRRLLRKKLSALAGRDSVIAVEKTRRNFAVEHLTARPYLPDTVYAVIRDEAVEQASVSRGAASTASQ